MLKSHEQVSWYNYIDMKEQTNTTYKLVETPHSSPTETTITDETVENSPIISKKVVSRKRFKCVGVSIFLLCLGLLLWGFLMNGSHKDIQSIPNFKLTENIFKFQVYCPMSYFPYLQRTDDESNINLEKLPNNKYKYGPYELEPSSIQGTDFDPNQTYIINIISTQDDSGTPILHYCGLAREWNGKCTQPIYTCTSPGPMFDFLIGSTVDVIWINQLNSKFAPTTPAASCMDPTSDPVRCSLNYQAQNVQIFKSPIKMHEKKKHGDIESIRISPEDWPISTHVHGLQVRPQFDGNPLAWFSNSGKRGQGIIPLDKKCYYDNFDNAKRTVPPNIKFTNSLYNSGTKVNRYINGQNPGNLWYHDHAMHLTLYNAANGLAGIYIIRDPKVQKLLPTGGRQKFLLKTVNGWANQSFSFEPEVAYRYRILNSDPNNITEISFTSEECSQPDFKTIPFTLIGADSSLFSTTMPNISKIQLGSAQRAELLISFDKSIQTFQICGIDIASPYPDPDPYPVLNSEEKSLPLKKYKTISTHTQIISQNKSQVKQSKTIIKLNQIQTLGVPYTNLSLIQEKDIRIFRMRPLMKNSQKKFLVNGHYDFHLGAHQNPRIGSIEDWFLINVINGAHPMHFHLALFQVTQILKLRYINNTNLPTTSTAYCSFYEMDFLLQAIIISQNETVKSLLALFITGGKIDYTNFCNFYKGGNIILNGVTYSWDNYYYGGIDVTTYDVNKQDEFDPQTRISGINIRELIEQSNSSYSGIIGQTNCPYNTANKYICRESTNNKPWYQRWKDTGLIDPMAVFKYRIRWTKTNYVKGGSYYQAPIDQMIQFPGFVYHCHILSHQEDEMMRAIMLQPPEDYLPEGNQPWKCHETNWEDKYLCLNRQCGASKQQDSSMKSSHGNTRRLQQE